MKRKLIEYMQNWSRFELEENEIHLYWMKPTILSTRQYQTLSKYLALTVTEYERLNEAI